MSHFAVAVFTKYPDAADLADALAPYNEQDEDFYDYDPCTPHEVAKANEEWEKAKGNYRSYEDFLDDWDIMCINPENGSVCRYQNPNAKWDWWSVGGRWMNMLTVKRSGQGRALDMLLPVAGMHCDSARVRDLTEIPKGIFAFIDEDGDWHEAGQMGWFGMSTETADSRKESPENSLSIAKPTPIPTSPSSIATSEEVNMSKINFCDQNCPNRTATCHAECSDYLAAALVNSFQSEEIRKKKLQTRELDEYTVKIIQRARAIYGKPAKDPSGQAKFRR